MNDLLFTGCEEAGGYGRWARVRTQEVVQLGTHSAQCMGGTRELLEHPRDGTAGGVVASE